MVRKFLYTKNNVLKAMQIFVDKHDHAPHMMSGVIEGECFLANGTRKWEDVYRAFLHKRVSGVAEDTSMAEFAKANNFSRHPTIYKYTKDTVLEAMTLFVKKHGYAPIIESGIIEGECSLANGKRSWEDVYLAFRHNRVEGVPKDTSMTLFANKIHKFPRKPISLMYTAKNVEEAMRGYAALNDGWAPDQGSGEITKEMSEELAGKTWKQVAIAFKEDYVGNLPEPTRITIFANRLGLRTTNYTAKNTEDALRKYVEQNGCLPQKDSGIISEEISYELAGKTWGLVSQAFDKGRVDRVPQGTRMQAFAKQIGLDGMIKSGKLNLIKIFNAVAWNMTELNKQREIQHTQEEKGSIAQPITVLDLTNEQLPEEVLEEDITQGALNYSDETKRISWYELLEVIYRGEVVGLDSNFNLAVFAAEVEERILEFNMKAPLAEEVNDWMTKAANNNGIPAARVA